MFDGGNPAKLNDIAIWSKLKKMDTKVYDKR